MHFRAHPAICCGSAGKNYREVWDPGHPRPALSSEPRNVRLSALCAPVSTRSKTIYTTFAGLELPNWSEANAPLLEAYTDQIPDRTGFAADCWSPIQGGRTSGNPQ